MIEAVKFWNEPNNKVYWSFDLDPGWNIYMFICQDEYADFCAAMIKRYT